MVLCCLAARCGIWLGLVGGEFRAENLYWRQKVIQGNGEAYNRFCLSLSLQFYEYLCGMTVAVESASAIIKRKYFMLFKLKKQITKENHDDTGKIFAVQNGQVIPITEVNDDVFAQKMLGDGVAIKPESGIIVSPVNGRIISIVDTFHAYGLQTTDGLEILVHIGIDTVALNGRGFQNHVQIDEEVKVGTPLCTVDLPFLKQNGYETDIIILVTDLTECDGPLIIHTGLVAKAQQTCIMEYHRKREAKIGSP